MRAKVVLLKKTHLIPHKKHSFLYKNLLMSEIFFIVLPNLNYGQKGSEYEEELTTEKTTEKILHLLAKNPNITSKEMAKLIGLTDDGVDWNLRKLKDAGLIQRVGGRKQGYWEIIKNK
jgi:predicted HTH transcriptional regulator